MEIEKTFLNGFTSWMETHHEIVAAITLIMHKDMPTGICAETQEQVGLTGLYSLAEQLTDEFEKNNEGRQWDGEFFEEVEQFCALKLR